MKEFKVQVTGLLTDEYRVKAVNEEKAIEVAQQAYYGQYGHLDIKIGSAIAMEQE